MENEKNQSCAGASRSKLRGIRLKLTDAGLYI